MPVAPRRRYILPEFVQTHTQRGMRYAEQIDAALTRARKPSYAYSRTV